MGIIGEVTFSDVSLFIAFFLPVYLFTLLLCEFVLKAFFSDLAPEFSPSVVGAVRLVILFNLVAPLIYYLIYILVYGNLRDSGVYFAGAERILMRLLQNHISLSHLLLAYINPSFLIERWVPLDNYEAFLFLPNHRLVYTCLLTILPYLAGAGFYTLTGLILSAVKVVSLFTLFLSFLSELKTYFRTWGGLSPLFVIGFLGVPSVVFWTSVPLKETYIVILFSLATSFFLRFISHPLRKGHLLLLALIFLVPVYNLRPWFFFVLLTAYGIIVFWRLVVTNPDPRFRFLFLTVIILILVVGGRSALSALLTELDEQFSSFIQGFVTWHGYLAERRGQFGYAIPGLDYRSIQSIYDILRFLPYGFIYALYRPFLWEASEPQHFLASLEALFLLGCSLYVGAGLLLRGFVPLKEVLKSPSVVGFTATALFYVSYTGVISYNYGALSRYKAPLFFILVFFMVLLILTIYERKDDGVMKPLSALPQNSSSGGH